MIKQVPFYVVGVFLCIIAIFYPIYLNKYFADDSGMALIAKWNCQDMCSQKSPKI